MPQTGAYAYAKWKAEGTTYKSTSETNWKSFGHECRVNSLRTDNSITRVYGLSNQEAVTHVLGAFTGSMSIDCILADPWIFKFLTGNTVSTSGSGPYTHKFLDTASSPGYNQSINSITAEVGVDLATDIVRTVKGAVCRSFKMSCNVDEPVRLSMEFDYADEVLTESGASSTGATSTDAPFYFAFGTLELPTGTTLTNVKSLELNINRTPEIHRAIGSRTGAFFITKNSEYTGRFTIPFDTSTYIKYFYNGATGTAPASTYTELAGLKFTLNNGLSGTSQRQLITEFTNVLITDVSVAYDVNELTLYEISFTARKWKSSIATNNTATYPA